MKYRSFKSVTRSVTTETPISLDEDIFALVEKLIAQVKWTEPVRLLGVTVSKFATVGELVLDFAHAKIILIVRKEADGIKRYVHLGTGNYNDTTAKLYTDIGLLTANDQYGSDASAFFNLLSGYSEPPMWNKLVMGNAYTSIISILIAAGVFAAGMNAVGLTSSLIEAMKHTQSIARLGATFGPFFVALLSGSGIAGTMSYVCRSDYYE